MDIAKIISNNILKHYNMGKEKPRPIHPHLITALVMQTMSVTPGAAPYVIERRLKPARKMEVKEMKRIYNERKAKMEAAGPREHHEEPEHTPVQTEIPAEQQSYQMPSQHSHDFQPQWLAEAFGKMFMRQERQHRAIDYLWEAGHYHNPAYPFVRPFDDLEQRLVNLSLHGQTSGGGEEAADEHHEGGDGIGGDYDPMSD